MKSTEVVIAVSTLSELRKELHIENDASVIEGLDKVIRQLEDSLEPGMQEVDIPPQVKYQVLEIILECVRIVSNLSEVIRTWSGTP